MFAAQYLMTTSTTGITVYSPWMARRGDELRFILDLVEAVNATITVTLFHKMLSDTGDGVTTATAIGPTATVARSVAEYKNGVKELVRYQFLVKANSAGVLGWALFRMLPPTWWNTVSGV